MTTLQASASKDLQELEIETFQIDELTELDANAPMAMEAEFSMCSSTTSSTTSSSCG